MNSKNLATELVKKISNKDYKVGVIGLGYVGLPLLWTFHKNNMPVIGFDIDDYKVDCVNNGQSYIKHLKKDMMEELQKSDRCEATTNFDRLKEADAILMCVPTPLDHHREPDMSYVRSTSKMVGKHLRKGQLVILESTTYPGTTEELIIPVLEKQSGLKAGTDFYVAYSPEREDPGNPDFNTALIPKIVGGNTPEALEIAQALYNTSIIKTVSVKDTKTAEAVKLTENIFRSVNIALVNELKVIYNVMDIDVNEVLDAADTKPFGFMKFTPGPGLGGHCIPIDPFYLTWKAREFKQQTRFIELAGEINTSMPDYVVSRTMQALNKQEKSLKGSKILLVGLAYKPDVDDDRESPTYELLDLFKKHGAKVKYYDPYIPIIKPSREHAHWAGEESVEWNKEVISSMDVVVISTNHSKIKYKNLAQWSSCIIDTRDAMKHVSKDLNNVIKA